MAATARSAMRASMRFASRPAARTSIPTFTQRAAFSVSSSSRKSEVIKETEVPVSVYSPDSRGVASANTGDHFSIPVRHPSTTQEPVADVDVVKPLSEKVYSQMPATMQKMSVMGKVIIVTG